MNKMFAHKVRIQFLASSGRIGLLQQASSRIMRTFHGKLIPQHHHDDEGDIGFGVDPCQTI